MNNKELINPVQIGHFNICPKCVTPSLFLVEKNLDMSYIDDKGNPSDHKNVSHRSNLICSNCRSKYDYKKKGTKILIYTEREKRLDDAMHVVMAEKKLDKFLFVRTDTDSEEKEGEYI